MEIATQRWLNGRWLIGGTLIAVGILILLMNVGIIERFPIWKFWPVILIALGIGRMAQPYKRAEGFWMVALGVWLQVSLLRLWGYGFGDTWPLVLIALGIFWMWESFEKESRKRKAEEAIHNTTS